MPAFWLSMVLTMNRLVSRNRSTQFSKHDASERENLLPIEPVMQLESGDPDQLMASSEICQVDARSDSRIPASVRQVVNGGLHLGFGLFLLKEARELLLQEHGSRGQDLCRGFQTEVAARTCVASSNIGC